MTGTLSHVLQWGILSSEGTGNYLLWEENPVGISVQALYTVRCCAYL